MTHQSVHFSGIRNKIIETLETADSEILIAVAWFTDETIISKVQKCIERGVQVSIIFFDDKINDKNLFQQLYLKGANIRSSKKLMHNKFCIVDKNTIINGSYNWTYNASTNNENIQISSGIENIVKEYINEFYRIFDKAISIEDYFKSEDDKFSEYLKQQPLPESYPVFFYYYDNYSNSHLGIYQLSNLKRRANVFAFFKNEQDYIYFHNYIFNRKSGNKNFENTSLKIPLFTKIYGYEFKNQYENIYSFKKRIYIPDNKISEVDLFDKYSILKAYEFHYIRIERVPLEKSYEILFAQKNKLPNEITTISELKNHIQKVKKEIYINNLSEIPEEIIINKLHFNIPVHNKNENLKVEQPIFQYFKGNICLVEDVTKTHHLLQEAKKILYKINEYGEIVSDQILFDVMTPHKNIIIIEKKISSKYFDENLNISIEYFDKNLKKINLPEKVYLIRENWIYFSRTIANLPFYGLMDIKGNILLPAIFTNIIEDSDNIITFESAPFLINKEISFSLTLLNDYDLNLYRNNGLFINKFNYDFVEKELKLISSKNSNGSYYLTDDNGKNVDLYNIFTKSYITKLELDEIKNYLKTRSIPTTNNSELSIIVKNKLLAIRTNEKDKNKQCYIATLVYKDINHYKLDILRTYRDEKLSKSFLGRIFIEKYYIFSPKLISKLRNKKLIIKIIKLLLDGFIKIID